MERKRCDPGWLPQDDGGSCQPDHHRLAPLRHRVGAYSDSGGTGARAHAGNPRTVRVASGAATWTIDALDTVADWTRPGRRSDGASFTIETFAKYLIHDPVHHLWDVRTLVE